ncbi:hypothetical protein [Dysgonomonas sp. HGC4]|uniref:hypothetical protein n=1 Tax=Dysgonomonas sp. HGC4 TaxID=1658009 RepID=UPI000682E8E4|nr:hypothetical protein [Dysgonomonas sp. HGC4]MBD8349357.1 hypothetical protein [Dysgonomonas sp. HGC4]
MPNNYSQEILDKIKEYAGDLMSPSQIAILLDLDEIQFRSDINSKSSPVYKAYHKGKIITIHKIRSQEVKLAKASSPMAVELSERYIADMEIEENA